MESFLRELIECHPEKEADIIRLAEADECFRAVCEEIELAENARIHWQAMPARAREYEEILNDLRKEFWAQLARTVR